MRQSALDGNASTRDRNHAGVCCSAACRRAAAGKSQGRGTADSRTSKTTQHGAPREGAGRLPGWIGLRLRHGMAAEPTDFALGSDAGSSVRVPTSYPDLFDAFPPTAAVGLAGVYPLVPNFDMLGWFPRTASPLVGAGEVPLEPWLPSARSQLLHLEEARSMPRRALQRRCFGLRR
jgi:hypothetical protein